MDSTKSLIKVEAIVRSNSTSSLKHLRTVDSVDSSQSDRRATKKGSKTSVGRASV